MAKNTRTKSYVIWNNKGGVGKSTLTFHLSTLYAHQHPERKVLVIDACPQVNISKTLLLNRENLRAVQKLRVKSVTNSNRPGVQMQKTIAGYLDFYSNNRRFNSKDFLVHVKDYNNQISENMYLLCGDSHLNIVQYILTHQRDNKTHGEWERITTALKVFIEDIANQEANWTVFIDTNTAFTIYTEIAIAAAENLIIPTKPDDYSYYAMLDLFKLLYGIELNNDYGEACEYLFYNQALKYNINVPKIYMIIQNGGNKYTKGNQTSGKSGKAFQKKTADSVFEIFRNNREKFEEREGIVSGNDFKKNYVKSINEMNNAGIESSYLGIPLYGDLPNSFKISEDSEESIRVHHKQKKSVLDQLMAIVNCIE